ncbi:hypothetical protein LEP1GSC089_4931 [Leptospira interrogans serovar Autumnalis str. LP101]|nr:hypothetical protein LEP1GSC089_4931 [Leptospira interrogans serovar Autumnalis str. LP101]
MWGKKPNKNIQKIKLVKYNIYRNEKRLSPKSFFIKSNELLTKNETSTLSQNWDRVSYSLVFPIKQN